MQQTILHHVPIDELVPHPDNARKGDTEKIMASIRANGFFGALVVQSGTNRILAGNHRWQAARRMGMETVPVLFVDCDDKQARKILLADNRSSDLATYDPDELGNLLKKVMAEGDLGGTGFDAMDLQRLIGDVIDEPNEKRKRNLEPFHNSYWLVKAPITMQGVVTEKIATALAKVEGVEIASATH